MGLRLLPTSKNTNVSVSFDLSHFPINILHFPHFILLNLFLMKAGLTHVFLLPFHTHLSFSSLVHATNSKSSLHSGSPRCPDTLFRHSSNLHVQSYRLLRSAVFSKSLTPTFQSRHDDFISMRFQLSK